MSRKQDERNAKMGMAASQARFLGLTARKTNTEYEGQQINQQRTTLSNQTANYYNQLLGMAVPTPPSTADYTKTVYTFTDGALNNSISSMIAQQGGKYLISYTITWKNDFATIASAPVLYTKDEYTVEEKGEKKTLNTLIDRMVNNIGDNEIIGVVHSNSLDKAKLLKEQIEELKIAKEIILSEITPTIASHVGPDAVGLAYKLKKQKQIDLK